MCIFLFAFSGTFVQSNEVNGCYQFWSFQSTGCRPIWHWQWMQVLSWLLLDIRPSVVSSHRHCLHFLLGTHGLFSCEAFLRCFIVFSEGLLCFILLFTVFYLYAHSGLNPMEQPASSSVNAARTSPSWAEDFFVPLILSSVTQKCLKYKFLHPPSEAWARRPLEGFY